MTGWNLLFDPRVISEDIPLLDSTIKKRIQKVIQHKLSSDPFVFGKPLTGSWRGHRSLRIGDWRVVYRILSESNDVLILKIAHRREVYDHD